MQDRTTRQSRPRFADQRSAYLEGHRKNPLTTTQTGAKILSASQVPWFTLFPPRGFGVLTTTGRKTGKARRRCVRAIREGDRAYLVSLRGRHGEWFRNVRASPEVKLRIWGGFFRGLAREITDPDELEHAKRVYAGTVNRFDWVEYPMHRPGKPTADKIRSLHEKWFTDGTPLVIELST